MTSETLARVGTVAGRSGNQVRCRAVRARLLGEVLNTWPLSPEARRHLESCLVCQAQAARYRAILRALRSLRDEIEEAPEWLADQIMVMLDARAAPDTSRAAGRAVAISVAASAAAATAAAVVLLRWIRSAA